MLPADVRDSVSFHGHVSRERVMAALQTCRLAVFPSFAEAFSMAPLEAMAQGCPVIYSNRCSGPELIDHGRNGLLIDPDRPEEIAAAITGLLRDDALAARLGASGRDEVARRFACNVLIARNEEFYRSCISRS